MKRPSGASPAKVLLAHFREANRRYGLLSGGERVLVAVSGGPDSVALLHLLANLPRYRLTLGVAHLHHGLRGADADADAEYVAALARRLGLPCFSAKVDAKAHAKAQRLSAEMAARELRYGFLERVADQEGYDRIALGHTASDRVETVLMHLLQGTGLPGLRGMPPRRGKIIRPLLTAWRQDTEAYCLAEGLEPCRDETNLDPKAARRNRIRHELLPHLREAYNPDVEAALLRLTQAVEAELEWTAPQVVEACRSLCTERETGVGLDREGLAGLPEGLRLRVWREAWARLHGEGLDLRSAHYAALERLLSESQTGRGVVLPGDITATKLYNEVFLSQSRVSLQPAPPWQAREVPMEGAVEIPELGIRLRLRAVSGVPEELGDARGSRITLDADTVALPLRVRPWQAGDELVPLGMRGHKKLQDVFVDEKVPVAERGSVAVVTEAEGQVVWVAGLVMDDRRRVTSTTRKCLQLSVEAIRGA